MSKLDLDLSWRRGLCRDTGYVVRQPSGPSVSEVVGQANEVMDDTLYEFGWHVILNQVTGNAHRFRRDS